MSTCAIRYRLNAPGPSAFIVECNGGMRMYTRGTLGGRLPEGYAMALIGSRTNHWVPASGELILDIDLDDEPKSGWNSVAAAPPPAARSAELGAGTLSA
jgi:hypothetical protein